MIQIKEDGEWISFTKEMPPNGTVRVRKGDREINMNCYYGECSNVYTGIFTKDVPLTIDDTCYWFKTIKNDVPPPTIPPPQIIIKPTATIAPVWNDKKARDFNERYNSLKIDEDAFAANPTIEGMFDFAKKWPDELSIVKEVGNIIIVRANWNEENIISEKMKDIIVVESQESCGSYLMVLEKL